VRPRYTPRALAELDEILTFIKERSPQGAQHVQARIQSITNLLIEHPKSGQAASNPNLRRIAAAPYPYLIFYKVTKEEIVIIAVRHSARNPASMPGTGHL
jgi:plasmid stabilization system protein ParE